MHIDRCVNMSENKNAEKGVFFRRRSAKGCLFCTNKLKSFFKGYHFQEPFQSKGVYFATNFPRTVMPFPGYLSGVEIL